MEIRAPSGPLVLAVMVDRVALGSPDGRWRDLDDDMISRLEGNRTPLAVQVARARQTQPGIHLF